MNKNTSLLSLDDAANQLNLTRRDLSAYTTALEIKRVRGEDRRTYLQASDVERIQEFRTGMESKVNPAYFGMTLFADVPQPHTMERNSKAYVREGYAANDSLYKCVNYISQNGAAIPSKLYTDRSMRKEIPSHPLLDKLEAPNPEQDGVLFKEAIL